MGHLHRWAIVTARCCRLIPGRFCSGSSGSAEGGATAPLRKSLSPRQISPAETWSALRPFVFATDPSLFAQYPEMRSVNQRSLRLLESFIDGLYHPTPSDLEGWPTSLDLQFYLQTRNSYPVLECPRVVNLELRDNNPYSLVKRILERCNLPTSHLPNLTESFLQRTRCSRVTLVNPVPEDWDERDERELQVFWEKKLKKYRLERNCLDEWVRRLRGTADEARRKNRALIRQLQNEVDWLCERSGLSKISWDPDWPLIRCEPYLLALRRILDSCPKQNGEMVRFCGGTRSFVSVDGCIILDVEDVPVKWLKTFVENQVMKAVFKDLPHLRSQVSDALGGAEVSCAAETPLTSYIRWTRKIVAGLTDNSNSFSEMDLKGVKFVLRDEANSLCVGYFGEVFLPCNTGAEELGVFLKENLDLCKTLKFARENLKELVKIAQEKAVKHLYLWDLTYDRRGLRLENVLECIERLLQIRDTNSFVECGLHISCSKGFGVLSDGKIKIPIEWEI